MRAKHWLMPWMLAALCSLSACTLLPEEETPRTAPLIRSYEREAFQTALVKREDLIQIEKVACKYVPVQSAALSFALGGEYVDKTLVQVGDSVKAGQLLAQLRVDDLAEQIDSKRAEADETRLRLTYLERQLEIERRRCRLTNADAGAEAQREAEEALEETFDERRQQLEDALYLQELSLEALRADLADRQICAPFDGTITYVRKYKDGDRSVFGERAITLADSTLSLFRAETAHWARFEPGQAVDITVKKKVYPAVVTTEEALGLPAQSRTEGEKASVYFTLREPSFELEDGDSGTISLVLDERRDVLTVPGSAVSSAGEQTIVYYQREDGMKAYKPVETGLTVNRRTEIISGLNEGESVIVP